MAQFGKKKTYADYLYTKPVLGLLFICIVFLGVSVAKRFTIEQEMHARLVEVQQKHQKLLQHKTDLQKQVRYLQGERGVEEEVRKQFDVARPGEQVVILVGGDASSSTSTHSVSESPKQKPWYLFWQ